MRRVAACLVAIALAAGPVASAGAMDGAVDGWLRPGPVAPAVRLLDQDGRPRSLPALLRDRPVVVNFFFTGCQAICPTQTAQLGLLQDEIDRRGLSGRNRPLILSVALDPFGDTPDAIRRYAGRFDIRLGEAAGWLMLTGDEAALRPVWTAFDENGADPAAHPALFWIARPPEGRWTRADITTDGAALLDLLAGRAE